MTRFARTSTTTPALAGSYLPDPPPLSRGHSVTHSGAGRISTLPHVPGDALRTRRQAANCVPHRAHRGLPTPPIWGKRGRLHHDASDDHDHTGHDSTNHTISEPSAGVIKRVLALSGAAVAALTGQSTTTTTTTVQENSSEETSAPW
jgi:hypothetical protein